MNEIPPPPSGQPGPRSSAPPPSQPGPGTPRRKARASASRGSEGIIPFFAALVLAIALQQLLNSTIPVDSYIYRLFRPAGGWVMGVVPGLIFFVFVWTAAELILKLRVALTNEKDLERPEVKQLPTMVAHEPTRATLHRLRAWDRGLLARPVGRRMLWLLRHLDTVDARRAHELVRHQADLDADSAASGYRAVKLFIWAMPILGFIGTVLGISLAVGGFSEFLTTNVSIDEIDAVTSELGEVASGLSFAFDTTLLGLLAGLVANVFASVVQGREERFITGVEELGLQVMSEAPSERAHNLEEATAPAPDHSAEIDAIVRGHLEELSTEMDQFTYTVRRGLQSLNEASARISRGMESSIESVNETMEGLGDHVRGTTDRLAKNMQAIEEANHRLATTLSALTPVLDQLAGPMEVRLMPRAITPPPHAPPPQAPASQAPSTEGGPPANSASDDEGGQPT